MEASLKALGGLLDGLGPRKVANMAPSWPPKRSQNELKIDPKIDQFFSASWNRFWKDFGGFWMPTWSQVGTQIDQTSMPIANSDFLKIMLSLQRGLVF